MYKLSSVALLAGLIVVGVSPLLAQVTFDFEAADSLDSSLVSGDKPFFVRTPSQAQSGTQGLKFDYSAVPEAFQSWTYDLPFAVQDGQIGVWFHDQLGADAGFNKFGGSIILEDKDAPGDFLAVEIWNGPYPSSGDPTPGAPNYYLTRGNASGATSFKSRYFGDRSVGWHQVVFNLSAAQSTALLDGIGNSDATGIVTGPGTNKNLRLRFMAWSASDGGFSNWTTDTVPTEGFTISTPYVTFDDLTTTATTPSANALTEGFEVVSGTATYDTAAVFMGPSAHDNPFMKNLVPQWAIDTNAAYVRTGTQSLRFDGTKPLYKSLDFDLSTATAGNITLSFHDALGPNASFDKVGGSIMIQDVSDPANFIALEIWNAPYPSSGDPTPAAKNYYLTRGTAGNPATTFKSKYFGDRQAGWNNVTIELTATTSKILVNGVENSDATGIVTGPGINDGIRLRLMADSASAGGFTNYVTATELQLLDMIKTDPYVTYDDIALPVPAAAGVNDWFVY